MKTLRPYQRQALNECLESLRESDDPVVLNASVGAGKSLILAELLLLFERQNKRALCIVNNAELVRSNAETYREQGGNPSIYCNALNNKDSKNNIVFGTPQSVLNGIKRHKPIADVRFNIIVVDEVHAIDYKKHSNTFMRILRHYKHEYEQMRVLGATGTPFRYKGEPIVGKECLFKKQVGNVTTAWLIENGYLVKPLFEVDEDYVIDFSNVRLNTMGKFDTKQMQEAVDKNKRLTHDILLRLQHIMDSQKRFGAFIFCCTKRHCDEAMQSLPREQTAVITAETSQKERLVILDKARKGIIRYLINVQVLTVGIDVPGFDTLLFLRPTESLVLAVQMIGRALRLFSGKDSALILDCAGNLDRHQDWDDPIILDAIKQTQDKNKPLIFPCPTCNTMNGEHARRCVGIVDSKRCDFYFEWKDCEQCKEKNDIAARYCRHCDAELIDPNSKLTASAFVGNVIEAEVVKSRYWIQESGKYTRIQALYDYRTQGNAIHQIYESYTPTSSEKAKNVFYGRFVKPQVKDSSFWYQHLQNPLYLKAMLNHIQTPPTLKLKFDGEQWKIKDKGTIQ